MCLHVALLFSNLSSDGDLAQVTGHSQSYLWHGLIFIEEGLLASLHGYNQRCRYSIKSYVFVTLERWMHILQN